MAPPSRVGIHRFWGHAALATLFVVVAPPALFMRLEALGHIGSPFLSVVGGLAGSLLAGALGSALWVRVAGSTDVVFSDLLPWGFLQRLLLERRIMDSAKLMEETVRRAAGSSASLFEVRTLQRLASALEATDSYTHGHSRRVARLACMIARELGLPKQQVQALRIAGAVHDVGKLYVPRHIINKPGKLTPPEFELIKQHSVKGAEMVARTGNRALTALVRHHHERVDGQGYPDGLAGADIPLGARILAVADTFDAITSSRSYRSASGHKVALQKLRDAAGTQLDPDVVQAFLAYYSGKRSLARWAMLFAGPHRLLGGLSGWFQGAAAAGLKGSAAAVGSAALLTGSVVTAAEVAPAMARHASRAVSVVGEAERGGGGATTSASGEEGLPYGLAKKEQLPRGLRKKDRLPPGLAKRGSGTKRAQPHKPDKGKDVKPRSKASVPDKATGPKPNPKASVPDKATGPKPDPKASVPGNEREKHSRSEAADRAAGNSYGNGHGNGNGSGNGNGRAGTAPPAATSRSASRADDVSSAPRPRGR